MSSITLRTYTVPDENAVVELWRRTWQKTYPKIDFAARVPWWQARLRTMVASRVAIILAERKQELIGFITVDAAIGYVDQMIVAPEAWGARVAQKLMAEAKRLSSSGLILHVNQDNDRALRFYEREGFVCLAEEQNPISGNMVYSMVFEPRQSPK